MFDLFKQSKGLPFGMSGTLLGVQVPISVLSGRRAQAIMVDGETFAFLPEMFSKEHGLDKKHSFDVKGTQEHLQNKEYWAKQDAFFSKVANRDSIIQRATMDREFATALEILKHVSGNGNKSFIRDSVAALQTTFEIRLVESYIKELAPRFGLEDKLEILRIDSEVANADAQVGRFKEIAEANSPRPNASAKDEYLHTEAGKYDKVAIVLTNRRGLTGLDYQGRGNLLLFDSTLMGENQMMQALWRVGRTVGDTRWQSHMEVYVDQAYVDNLLESFRGSANQAKRDAWVKYFVNKLNDPSLAGSFKTKDGTDLVALFRETVSKPSADVKLEMKDLLALSVMVQSAVEMDQTARALLDQLVTFRLMMDPLRDAFGQAMQEGRFADADLLKAFGEHLHRRMKGDSALDWTDKITEPGQAIQSILLQKADTVVKEFKTFLGDRVEGYTHEFAGRGRELSATVKQVIDLAISRADKVNEAARNDYAGMRGKDTSAYFQGNMTELAARPDEFANAMIAIAQKFEIDILPTDTTFVPERNTATQSHSIAGGVKLEGAQAQKMAQTLDRTAGFTMEVGRKEHVRVIRDSAGKITNYDFNGQKIDIATWTSFRLPPALNSQTFIAVELLASGSILVSPDIEHALQHGKEQIMVPVDVLQSMGLSKALTAKLTDNQRFTSALSAQNLIDSMNLNPSD
ncbi:MAG: hypothetical protein ABTQ25_02600, partial [Nitrosomonas ureae]